MTKTMKVRGCFRIRTLLNNTITVLTCHESCFHFILRWFHQFLFGFSKYSPFFCITEGEEEEDEDGEEEDFDEEDEEEEDEEEVEGEDDDEEVSGEDEVK